MFERYPEGVTISDVTLREYGQNVPRGHLDIFTPQIRAQIAKRLLQAGFKSIEVFSCIHPKISPAMNKQALLEIAQIIGRLNKVQMITLVPNKTGYKNFLDLDLGPSGYNHTMGIFFSAIESHNMDNLGRSIEQTLWEYQEILKDAQNKGIKTVAYISAAFGYLVGPGKEFIPANPEDINRYMDFLLEQGVERITFSDLQGAADHKETRRQLEAILNLRQGKDMDLLGYHPHHLSSQAALENSRAAFDLGIRRFDASLGGSGGCVTGAPGNQPTEGLLEMFNSLGVSSGLDPFEVYVLADKMQEIYSKIPLEH